MPRMILQTPAGLLILTEEDGKIHSITFGKASVRQRSGSAVLRTFKRELQEYFAGKRRTFSVAVNFSGSAFDCAVWRELRKIPYGTTVTYGEIARRIGQPKAARAVGGAVGRNQLAILVPCHRVTAAHGLGGFAWGAACKRKLLAIESSACAGQR